MPTYRLTACSIVVVVQRVVKPRGLSAAQARCDAENMRSLAPFWPRCKICIISRSHQNLVRSNLPLIMQTYNVLSFRCMVSVQTSFVEFLDYRFCSATHIMHLVLAYDGQLLCNDALVYDVSKNTPDILAVT